MSEKYMKLVFFTLAPINNQNKINTKMKNSKPGNKIDALNMIMLKLKKHTR